MYLESPYTTAEIGIEYPDAATEQPEAPTEQPQAQQENGLQYTTRIHGVITDLDILVTSMILDARDLDSMMSKQREAGKIINQLREAIYEISGRSWNDGFKAANDGLPF